MNQDRQMIVLGNEPNSVDLLAFLDDVDFDAAWAKRASGKLAGEEVFFVGREDYI